MPDKYIYSRAFFNVEVLYILWSFLSTLTASLLQLLLTYYCYSYLGDWGLNNLLQIARQSKMEVALPWAITSSSHSLHFRCTARPLWTRTNLICSGKLNRAGPGLYSDGRQCISWTPALKDRFVVKEKWVRVWSTDKHMLKDQVMVMPAQHNHLIFPAFMWCIFIHRK